MADDFGLDLGFGGGGLGFPRKRRRKIDEFSAEEEESLLSTIGNKALGGVAMAGNLLDLPGSSVRDVLAGQNPFDQWLDPLGSDNRTTGRDLLRQNGMVGGEDTWGNWFGGLGAEIALDPTTYLTGGLSALGKGGKAFKAAGVLDDAAKVGLKAGRHVGKRLSRMTTSFKEGFDLLDDAGRAAVQEYATKAGLDLASVADEPIQSLGRVSLPFTDIGFNFGSGKLSQGIAGGLDWAGDVLKQTAPVRMGRALFDPSVNDMLGYAEQQIAEEAYKAKWKSERAAKQAHVNLLSQMDEGFKAFNETMGPEIAARNQAAWDGFKTKLETVGNLNPEQTEAISQVWKGYAEGYLKMEPGEAVQRLIADIQPGGALDPKALKQESQYKFQQFYSKFARVADQKLGSKFSWDQLKATLKNNGVKDEELRDLGLEAAFGGKKGITKQEVAQHYLDNSIKVEEVVRGAGAQSDELKRLEGDRQQLTKNRENARTLKEIDDAETALAKNGDAIAQAKYDIAGKFSTYTVPGGVPDTYRELLFKLPDNVPGFQEGHFPEKNVLAHARVDDVMLPDGRKALRIQEIQSDWHQGAADKGYLSPDMAKKLNEHQQQFDALRKEANAIEDAFPDGWEGASDAINQKYSKLMEQMDDVYNKINELPDGVPDGPFKDSWQDLAVKQILKRAAEEGYESIVMVHGKDIAKAVGGPADQLGTYYDEIITNKISGQIKKFGGRKVAGAASKGEEILKQTKEAAFAKRDELDALNIEINDKRLQLEQTLRRDVLSEASPLEAKLIVLQAGEVSMEEFLSAVKDAPTGGMSAEEIAKKVQWGELSVEEGLTMLGQRPSGDAGIAFDVSRNPELMALQEKRSQISKAYYDLADRAWQLEKTGSGSSPYRTEFTLPPKLRESILSEGQPLYQQAAGATKGAVTFGEDGKALVQFFGAADVSTHLHEASHVMRRHLTDADNEIANAFVGATPGKKWTVDQEEKWARGFENYMTTGKAPSKGIKAVFERLKQWMVGIYSSIKGSAVDVKLTPQIKELYGRLIGSTPGPRKVGNSIAYETYDKLVRLGGELGGDVDTAWKLLSNGAADLPDSVKAQVKDIGENLKKINADIHSSIESKGGKANWILERDADAGSVGFAHVPRYVDMKGPKDLAELRAGKVLKTSHSGMQKRSDAIRAVPAEIVNKLVTDDQVREKGATEIASRYGQYLDEGFEVDGVPMGKDAHAEALANFVKEHKAAPLFTNSTAQDFLKYQAGAQAVSRNLDAMHEIVSRTMSDDATGITIERAFKNAGLSDEAIVHWAGKNGLTTDDAFEMTIPMDVANALVTTNKIYDSPEWAKAIGTTIDDIHNWWKGSMTVLFPSFHSRNLSSGQYMNMVASGEIQTLADIGSYTAESYRIARQIGAGTLPKELLEELYVNGVITKHANRDAIGSAASSSDLMSAPPGLNALNALSIFSTAKQAVKDTPRYIDAVPGAVMTRNLQGAALETGARVAENVEFMNRVPMYLYLKKKGWSAEAAAQKVNDLQVDYGAMTSFEKTVMKRLAPFYSFNRRIAPVILGTILERPGGGLAQTIKASADLSNADPLTPEHVASTLSIPNPLKGEDADFAGKSYLTGFGLPHEQLGQFFGGPQTMLREAASQTSPLLKAPLEWATGQSFFQAGPGGKGRDLEDLDPTIGRTIGNLMGTDKVSTPTALEHFVANSPLSRVAGTARQLTDSRKNIVEKGVNLLTGVKVSDVSESNQERVIQQRALDLMDEMGARTFAKPYFPSEIEEAMTPEEQKQAQALELLQAVLADRQKRRKAKKGK